jgi:flagellar M-ring protein FliF
MNDRLKSIKERLKNFWEKYDKKQKTIMISITLTVILFVVIMSVILSRPTYKTLIQCSSTSESAQVLDALDGAGIEYETSTDGLTVKVKEEDLSDATIELGANSIPAEGYSIDDALNGGFSSTEADKEKKYKAYFEDKIRLTLEQLDYVEAATVTLNIPTAKLSVLDTQEETSVSVFLNLKKDMKTEAVDGLAKYLATAVGNETTDNVTIIDSNSNLLFMGSEDEDDSNGVSPAKQNEVYETASNNVIQNITRMFKNQFTEINVAPHLDISFDKTDTQQITYDTGDREQGPYTSSYNVDQTGGESASGVPGTDSNDEDITYEIDTGDGTSTYSLSKYEYAVNQTVTTTTGATGVIDYKNSSVAIVLNNYVVYDEDDLKKQGQLKDTTWDEFKADNADPVPIDVSDDMIDAVALATGFDAGSVSVMAYQIPMFQASDNNGIDYTKYITIALAIIILGILAFVVWRSLRPVEVTETEPELSVEELLSSTKENQIEDIELNDKSEVKAAIEKLIDENSEAVAMLLRNWLNDDWG